MCDPILVASRQMNKWTKGQMNSMSWGQTVHLSVCLFLKKNVQWLGGLKNVDNKKKYTCGGTQLENEQMNKWTNDRCEWGKFNVWHWTGVVPVLTLPTLPVSLCNLSSVLLSSWGHWLRCVQYGRHSKYKEKGRQWNRTNTFSGRKNHNY